MTQKDKVKELVGRGLHSYHTKSLQQIDRIEKKNKEQNHKISILTNELDNDYLTKTEEGSVVSLEHSKEGMIYLDELQGNTLVNYCTDGSKEMTLNGDIDVEGTFITTTEGVDNGKVDVLCEGNTLVNLVGKMPINTQAYYTIDENYITILDSETDHRQGYYTLSGGQLNLIKPNTTYTIIAEITKNTLQGNFTLINNYQANKGDITSDCVSVPIGFVGRCVGKFTTLSDFTNRNRLGFSAGSGNRGEIILRNNFIILEGDWTNKEIPPYFEGMKSVGQDDENGHKIEILSRNKNLFDIDKLQINNGSLYGYMYIGGNDNYTLSITDKDTTVDMSQVFFGLTKNGINAEEGYRWLMGNGTISTTSITHNVFKYFSFFPNNQETLNKITSRFNIQIEEGHNATTYVEHKSNKKEILLNEPLRKSNDSVKDRFVKIGGKWFIERNCLQITIDGNEPNVTWRSDGVWNNVYRFWSNNFPNCITLNQEGCTYIGAYEKVYQANAINIQLSTSKILEDNVEIFVEYLKKNPLTVVIKKSTPTYEEITDVELITYLDTTHISNNSLIPCNMKIQNSGYNAIIKPSTLYTIALDTNKSGTIGMNLGGTKGTTTNNVLTLTTPATLTDDSLRLHGKGIKGSKVRLLEGDKTNWIPSYFEGMKSSFEDRFDTTDNTYKMEISSSNENLFNVDALIANQKDNKNKIKLSKLDNGFRMTSLVSGTWLFSNTMLKLKPNKRYKIKFKTKNDGVLGSIKFWIPNPFGVAFDYGIHNGNQEYEYNFITNKEGEIHIQLNTTRDIAGKSTIDITDISITELNHVENKLNKIQFSSIEPLRGVDDVKDRFVFKDNKLMIERNVLKVILDKNAKDITYTPNTTYSNNYLRFNYRNESVAWGANIYDDKIYCDTFPNMKHTSSHSDCKSVRIHGNDSLVIFYLNKNEVSSQDANGFKEWLQNNPTSFVCAKKEPTYEEIPFELQKIILEGYENGTLFFDTNIPPTSTVTYAGETPIVKVTKLNKTEVLNNTNDINDNIIPYLMDMDYRVVSLQLQSDNTNEGVSMARLFGGTYEMLQRDIQSKRLSKEEYGYRLIDYFNAGKLTEEEVRELEDLK